MARLWACIVAVGLVVLLARSWIAAGPTAIPTRTPTRGAGYGFRVAGTVTRTPIVTSTRTRTPVAPGGRIRITGMLRDGVAGREEPDEYVELTNVGDAAADLSGWRLESERRGEDDRQVFVFPAGFAMGAGKVCRVYTNERHPEWCGLSFGHRGGAVWANRDPDAARLVDAAGDLVDRWE